MREPKAPSVEVVALHAWCTALLRLILEGVGEPPLYLRAFFDALDRGLARADRRGLKMAAGDLREWAAGLPPHRYLAIDQALKARFGIGLVDEEKAATRTARRVLRRGSIADDDECRSLKAWLNGARAGSIDPEELAAIERLVAGYDSCPPKGA